jgi:hypothetical protein
MKLYTASKFANYERVRAFNDAARAAGHKVTHDWTRTAEFDEHGHPRQANEAKIAPELGGHHAALDLYSGVAPADMLVFLAEDGGYCGALIEFGAACALGKPILIVAPWRASIFWHLPNVTIVADEDDARARLGMEPSGLRLAA